MGMLIFSANDNVELINEIQEEHHKRFGFYMIAEGVETWIIHQDDAGQVLGGVAIATLTEQSYPFVVEEYDYALPGTLSEGKEVTNLFKFVEDRQTNKYKLLFAAYTQLQKMGLKYGIMFTRRKYVDELLNIGVHFQKIRPAVSAIDVPRAIENLRKVYGDQIQEEGETKYLAYDTPRSYFFVLQQTDALLQSSKETQQFLEKFL
ncbi:hypothetical protein [Algicola sagamiensis]|uniref:hypothetical protein n=1 Tax=Algicola sagamiensis TaxID=163869 RepID=UPI00035C95BF|nr:hypothetical protein [Algicola sagamiensis]